MSKSTMIFTGTGLDYDKTLWFHFQFITLAKSEHVKMKQNLDQSFLWL